MAQLLTGTRIYGTGTVDTQLFVSGTNSATSTTTGALQVVGGVGIGGDLHVGGIIYGAILGTATTATNADNIKTVLSTSTSVFFPVFVDSNNATAAYEAVYSSSTFTIIPSSGNVGIGTSSPAYKLDVVGTGSIISATRADTNRADIIVTNTGGTVAFGINNAAGNWLSNGLGYYGYILGPSNASYGLQFGVGASNTAALTITPSGNVGIGFTAPNGKLDVAGDLYVGATQNTARFKSDNTNTFVDAIPGAGAVVIRAGGSVEKLRVTANGGISFGASGTAYGVSGQILQSNGDAAPTWISTGSLAAANATTATHLSGGVAGQIPYQTAPGVTAFLSTGTAGDVLVSNGSSAATYNNTLRLAGSTNATSTSSGALQVVGGVGVGGDLFIHGDIRTNDTLFNLINGNATTVNFAGDATTLTMGASGSGTTNVRNNLTVSGNLTVQGTTTIVDSTVTNIADPIITLGGGTGNSAPTADDNKDRGVAFKYVNNAGTTSTGFFGYDDSTGYLTYVQTATITNEVVSGTKGAMDVNLAGGTAMSIHYQSAADNTAFLAASTSGYLLQTNGTGSAPTWVSASGVSAGSATYADSIRTIAQTASASYYPTFVDSNNASNTYELVYTTSSFQINASNGQIDIGTTGRDYQPSSGGSHTLRLNAANTSSIGFHDSGSTIGNLKFSGAYGFEIGAYDGLYGPHNTILHGSVGVGTQSPGAKLEVYVSRTASTNAIALLLNDNVTGAQTNGVYKAIRSASNSGSSVSEIRFLETDGTNNNTGIAFATANVAGGLTERVRIDFDGSVGIGTQSLGAKLHVSASQDNSILRKEVLRVERVGGAAALAGAGRTSEIAFADASNPTLTASIGGLREAPDGNFNGSLVFYTSITGGAVASAVTSLTERLRITSSGAIAFSGSASYGSSGQVLQSNGNAAPTWVSPSTLASASATNADNIRTIAQAANASYYPTFVDSNNASNAYELVYTTSSFTINPQSGVLTTGIGSAISYGDGTTYLVWIDEPEVSVLHTSADSNYKNMKTFVASKSGSFKLKFSAYIQSGPKYWGWRILKNGSTVSAGPYAWSGGLDSGQTASVHGYVRFAVTISDVVPGDSFVLQMVSTAGGSTPDIGGNQLLYAKEFRVYSTTPSVDHGGATNIWGAQVGIGTTSPVATMDVRGGLAVSGWSNNNGGSAGGLEIGWDGTQGIIQSYNRAGSAFTPVALNGSINKFLTGGTERLRITANGGISFGASGTAYGTSGQVLQSNGDAAPTWVAQSTIAAGSAPLTNTYVGFGSGSNLLTGSANLTYASSILNVAYQNTFDASTPGFGTYGLHFNGQTTAGSATGITFSAGAASATNANAGIYSQGSGSYGTKMYFATTDSYAVGAKTRMMIDHAGNVGIGTVNPSAKLEIGPGWSSGAGLKINYGNSSGTIEAVNFISNGGTNGVIGMQMVSAGVGDLWLGGSGGRTLTLYRDGNVGINSIAPASKLTVEGSGTANESVARFNNQGDYASRIWLRQSSRSAYLSVSGSTGDTLATGSLPYGLLIGLSGNPSPVQFYNGTSGAVKMTIDTVGNVGIGTTTPTAKFEVAGTAGQLFSVSDSFTGTIFSVNDVSGIPSIEVIDTGLVKFAQYGGQVAINTGTVASSTASLSVYGMIQTMGTLGEIRASSEITAYFSSDRRLKENIKLIENPITIIDQIRGVTFDWTDEHMARRGGEDGYFVRKHDIGVIAQEVQAVLPELVGTREDGYLAVKYEKLVPLLIEAIKTQQKTIDSLVKDLDTVKEFINNLKNGI